MPVTPLDPFKDTGEDLEYAEIADEERWMLADPDEPRLDLPAVQGSGQDEFDPTQLVNSSTR